MVNENVVHHVGEIKKRKAPWKVDSNPSPHGTDIRTYRFANGFGAVVSGGTLHPRRLYGREVWTLKVIEFFKGQDSYLDADSEPGEKYIFYHLTCDQVEAKLDEIERKPCSSLHN